MSRRRGTESATAVIDCCFSRHAADLVSEMAERLVGVRPIVVWRMAPFAAEVQSCDGSSC
jgi:hypothetical protein